MLAIILCGYIIISRDVMILGGKLMAGTSERVTDERDNALREILATRLAQLPPVAAFRSEVLKDKLMKPTDVEEWLYQQDDDLDFGIEEEPSIELWYVDFDEDGEPFDWPYDIYPGGVLERLRDVAKQLEDEYEPLFTIGEATTFVLTNEIQINRVRIGIRKGENLPMSAARIEVLLDPSVSIKEVTELYSKYRNLFFGIKASSEKKYKPLQAKHARLAVFIEENRGAGTWDELRKKWNKEQKKEWHYGEGDTWNFSRAAKVAWERVTGDKFGSTKRKDNSRGKAGEGNGYQ